MFNREPKGGSMRSSEYIPQSPYLNQKQSADYIGVKERTLEAWRHRGGGPKYGLISNRLVFYRLEDLDAFMEARLRSSTSDPGTGAE